MKRLAILAALAATFGLPAQAGGKHHHHHYGTYTVGGGTIMVSCYRGPWKQVIWDRPNAVFIDSLVAIGYDFPTAHAIGERVCRDEALVGNRAGLRQTMTDIYRRSPAYR